MVTGGNSGIGKAIALELARQKRHVVIVCRDGGKGRAAQEEIRKATSQAVDLLIGDLGTIAGAKKLAKEIQKKCPNLSVLINNAGIWPTRLELNTDGFERSFMVNHLAPFILSRMLLGQLKKNRPARIVNLNAGLYPKGQLDIDKTPYGKDFGKIKTYMNTKLCNIYFTRKFAREIGASGVTINALHPGVIRTNLGNGDGFLGLFLRVLKVFWGSPERGAKAPVWLATAPELEKANGNYYELTKPKEYSANARDEKLSETLWEFTRKATGL